MIQEETKILKRGLAAKTQNMKL